MRAITHEVTPGVHAEVRLDGDVFEMEDQRNWTDASFKTYSPPIALPYPVEIPAGTLVEQSVTLTLYTAACTLESAPAPAGSASATGVGLILQPDAAASRPLPQIGLGVATHRLPLSTHETALLRRLAPAHLRLDLTLAEPDWERHLAQATAEAQEL